MLRHKGDDFAGTDRRETLLLQPLHDIHLYSNLSREAGDNGNGTNSPPGLEMASRVRGPGRIPYYTADCAFDGRSFPAGVCGRMFRFERNRLSGSYRSLTSTRRLKLAPYVARIRPSPSSDVWKLM